MHSRGAVIVLAWVTYRASIEDLIFMYIHTAQVNWPGIAVLDSFIQFIEVGGTVNE